MVDMNMMSDWMNEVKQMVIQSNYQATAGGCRNSDSKTPELQLEYFSLNLPLLKSEMGLDVYSLKNSKKCS